MHDKLILPEADILLHSGDFTYTGHRDEIIAFNKWQKELNFSKKIVVAGNHEFTLDLEKEREVKYRFGQYRGFDINADHKEIKSQLKDCIYLEDESVEIHGIKIYGTPWQYPFHHGGFQRRDEDREKLFDKIPENVDILLTHTPPRGHLDRMWDDKRHVGDEALAKVLKKKNVILNCFGHIHEDYGMELD